MNEQPRHSFAWTGLLVALAACLLLVACTTTHTSVRRQMASHPPAPQEPSSVLFIGNSYSFDVPQTLRRIAARHGKKIRVDQVTYGGWSLAQHTQNKETLRKIREGSWDVVVIQEQSRIPSLPDVRTHAMFPHVRALADEARAHGAVPMLYQTWGYRDGDPNHLPADDFTAMTRRLRDGYQAAAADAGGLTIIPAGDAWEREIAANKDARLFQADGSHPTSRGNRLTAQTIFETLFPMDS